jgi:hypothetical protein
MSDEGTPPEPPAEPVEPAAETVDWKAKAREWEKRAKENKSAADELAAIREANKTESERAAERLAQAERDAHTARAEALRYKIATRYRIDDDDAEEFLTGTDEDALTRQAERLSRLYATKAEADAATPAGTPRPDGSQGQSSSNIPLNGNPLLEALKAKVGIS